LEKYEEWKLVESLPDRFYVGSFRYEEGKLEIVIDNFTGKKQVTIKFNKYLTFRTTVESGRLKSLDNHTLKSFNKTQESDYISWFRDEGLGIYDERQLIHYAIVGLNYIVDIISEEEQCIMTVNSL
jgi:hypothetical protein